MSDVVMDAEKPSNKTAATSDVVHEDGIPNNEADGLGSFRLRPYQVEMVEASLQQNLIVAMDTGSGKTHM